MKACCILCRSLYCISLLFLFSRTTQPVRAQLDQQNWYPDNVGRGVNIYFGVQQEFTPTLHALDTVQIPFGADSILVPAWLGSGSAAVRIRSGGVAGPVIGVSEPTYLPPQFMGGAIFRFPTPVELTPGQLYALEPFSLDGTGQWMLGFTQSPGYAGGRAWFGGAVSPAEDLVFLEGVGLVPEPSPLILLCVAALGQSAFRRCHRR